MRDIVRLRSNMAIDTDVLAARFRVSMARRSSPTLGRTKRRTYALEQKSKQRSRRRAVDGPGRRYVHGARWWRIDRPGRRHVDWSWRRNVHRAGRRAFDGAGRGHVHGSRWRAIDGPWWRALNRPRRRAFDRPGRWYVDRADALYEQHSTLAGLHPRVGEAWAETASGRHS